MHTHEWDLLKTAAKLPSNQTTTTMLSSKGKERHIRWCKVEDRVIISEKKKRKYDKDDPSSWDAYDHRFAWPELIWGSMAEAYIGS